MKIDETEDINTLKKLLVRPQAISKTTKEIEDDLNKLSITDQHQKPDSSSTVPGQREEKILFKNENLDLKISQVARDSDDDDDGLVQYDLSNDVPLNTSKKPAFLRDCLESKFRTSSLAYFRFGFLLNHSQLQILCIRTMNRTSWN